MSDYEPQAGRAMPRLAELSRAQSDSDAQDVLAAVRDLAGLVADVDELDDLLAQIAAFAVAAVPGAGGAGVTVMRAGDGPPAELAWAVTDTFVRELDHIQYDLLREGPCLSAMQHERVQVSGSLGSDKRWPRFGGRAARLTVHSAMSLPLIVRGAVVGAINIYAHDRDAFTEHAVRLAEQFAHPAAVSVGNIQVLHATRARAEQLQTALTTRAVIDQAIGIVRSRSGGDAKEAFARLRQLSQAEDIKLAVVAERLVEEAVRRAHARTSAPTIDS